MKQGKPGDAASGIQLLPCSAKGARGTGEHLPQDPANLLLPLSRWKNAGKVLNLPFS